MPKRLSTGTLPRSSIRYNPYIRNDGSGKTTPIVNVDGSFGVSLFVLLGHELFHALELKYGKNSNEITGEIDPDLGEKGMTESESRARKKENEIRAQNNIVLRKLPYFPLNK